MKTLANLTAIGVSSLIQSKTFAYKTILLLTLFFFTSTLLATHVVGGGITYTKLENDDYLLEVKLYRDCTPGNAQLPGNVNVQCRRGNDGSNPGNFGNHVLPLISATPLQPGVPGCAFDPGICIEEAIYQAVVTIPDGPGGYHLYYTICCRNGTILNIVNPLGTRETFYAYIPERGTLTPDVNSSPQFTGVPPVYVCAGQPLDLSFSAFDPDGDSLDYYFYTPFDGNAGSGITYGAGAPPNNITISPVTWANGFGATDPLDLNPGLLPGLTIDNTGFISGTPPAQGQYVVGVMVDEYRNGVLIGRISRDFQFNVINCPPPLEAVIDITTNCNGLTIDFLNQSTGIFNNSWWDFGTGNLADSSLAFQPQFNFPNAGTFDVTLIIEKGTACADTAVYQVTVMDPVQFNLSIDSVTCNGLGDGAALANSTDPLYEYNWSTMQMGNSISNLNIGNYWVYATNTIGCIDTQLFDVFEPAVLAAQFNGTNPLCTGDANGQFQVIATGGTAPYNFYWPSQNFNGNPITGLTAGLYNLQLTDANGCILNDQSQLTNPPALNSQIVSQTNVTCNGLADGSVTVDANGGTPNYLIDWLTLPNDAFVMNNLAAGSYVAEITDANGCLSSLVVDIIQPDTFTVDIFILQEETCTGANGQALADVTNGIGLITYLWTPTGQVTNLATGLSAGQIQVTVEDENGCQDVANAILFDNPTGVASVGNSSPVSCVNGNDGMVEILMNGGTAPFQYSWSCSCSNNNIQSNLSSGTYWVAVQDDNGCIDSLSFIVDELPELVVSILDQDEPACNGYSDGYAIAGATGGTQAYNYLWNTNPAQYTAMASGLSQGTYTVQVTDNNGCTDNVSVIITEPTQLVADAQSIGNILCFGDSAGVATVNASGATGPYTYYWLETTEVSQTIDSLPSGMYHVTVTDDNGCQAYDSTEIIEYANVHAQIIADSIFCPGDYVTFYVSTNGLNNQYDYQWYVNNVLEATTNIFSHQIFDTSVVSILLVNTGYCPDVKDSLWLAPIFMKPNNVDITGTPDTICMGSSAMIQGHIIDTAYLSSMYWNDAHLIGYGPHTVTPEVQTTYYFTAQNSCGESQTDSLTVNVFLPPNAYVLSDGTSGCDEVNVDFSYSHDPYNYDLTGVAWQINYQDYTVDEPQVNFTGSSNVIADLFLSFSNGCTFEYNEIVGVEVFESPDADFYFNPDPALVHEITEFVDISKGNPQEWEWYFEGSLISTEERPTHVFNETGEYTVTQIIINEYGCSDTMIHTVEVIGSYTVFVPNAFTPDGNDRNNNFKPIMSDIVPDNYEFLIFNRWGEVIYRTNDLEGEWDGNFQGENVKDGVYIWKVFVTDNVGLEHELMGHVTLLR